MESNIIALSVASANLRADISTAQLNQLKMLAVRQRAAYIARRARPADLTPRQATRSYASDHNHGDHHHDHHHAPEVAEPLGVRIPFLGWTEGLYLLTDRAYRRLSTVPSVPWAFP